ncbi:MAG: tryptophan-specific transport protein [Kiritimatiellia bacterium]|jgi:tryptophan-specific transport protein
METIELAETETKASSMLGGIAIITGGAIGAGMFSLPIVSSGMWFGWTLACMLLSWFCMYHISLMIMEVNLHFRHGANYDTMIKATLGKYWNISYGLLFAFLLYTLEYAYISGGSSIVILTLESTLGYSPSQVIAGLTFALLLASVVWMSTKAVDRVISIMIVGMMISLILAVTDLTLAANLRQLLIPDERSNNSYFPFVFAALPFYLTAFGFHPMVPSLIKYYGKKPVMIGRCMLIGSCLCFLVYLLWLVSTMGNLQRQAFLPIIAEGGNIGVLVAAINQVVPSEQLEKLLNSFANLAIITSFLGVSLALFDFVTDKFNFSETPLGRLKTAIIVFLPPIVGGVFFPDGFILAIGFAGMAVAFTALIVPPLMLKRSRKIFAPGTYVLWGGNKLIYFIFAMGIFYASCHILAMLNLLPVYGR